MSISNVISYEFKQGICVCCGTKTRHIVKGVDECLNCVVENSKTIRQTQKPKVKRVKALID